MQSKQKRGISAMGGDERRDISAKGAKSSGSSSTSRQGEDRGRSSSGGSRGGARSGRSSQGGGRRS